VLSYALFDLDGTLLPMDMDEFLGAYTRKISAFFSRMVDPHQFGRELMAATYAMIGDPRPDVDNMQKFMDAFCPKIGHSANELNPLLDRFYRDEFPQLVSSTHPSPRAREAVQAAINSGFTVVLATSPVFPEVAIKERMRWAGIEDLPWEYITTLETMCSAKPRLSYYQDLVGKLGTEPRQCLMIGNDVEEDLAAGELGMKTYFVGDWPLNRRQLPVKANAQGSLADLVDYLRNHSASQILA
jgi:FMN phosphatase YigB (HAD superfamily)